MPAGFYSLYGLIFKSRWSFPLPKVLADGIRTADIYTAGTKKVSCSEMGDAVVAALRG